MHLSRPIVLKKVKPGGTKSTGVRMTKRQRSDEGIEANASDVKEDASSANVNTDTMMTNGFQPVESEDYLVTLGSYGSIKLSKEALQAYPLSMLSTKLLGEEGTVDRKVYVPIGRGLKNFPSLIEDIYNCGVPTYIPSAGVHFDLFLKWLRNLELAVPDRCLSDETEAGKRISFFVLTMLNSLRSGYEDDPRPPRISRSNLLCVRMPPDIKRHITDLVPFEFARRGVHMSVVEHPRRSVQQYDWNLSKLTIGYPWEDLYYQMTTDVEPEVVTGVYPVTHLDSMEPYSYKFEHGGHQYRLSWPGERIARDLFTVIDLVQLDAGSYYDGRDSIERLILVPAGEADIVEEFTNSGGTMKYDADVHGHSLIADREFGEAWIDCPLMHGVRVRMPSSHIDALNVGLAKGYLLVVTCNAHPIFTVHVEETHIDDSSSEVYEFAFEESPDWTIHGDPPLPP